MNLLALTLGSTHEFIGTWQRAFNFSSPKSYNPLFKESPHPHLLIIRSQLHKAFNSVSIPSEDKCTLKKTYWNADFT